MAQPSRRQRQTRIYLPLIALGIALVLLPLLVAVVFLPNQYQVVADVAFVIIALGAMLPCFVVLGLLLALISSMGLIHYKTRHYLRVIYSVTHEIRLGTHQLSKTISAPLIAMGRQISWLDNVIHLPHSRSRDNLSRK